MPGRVAFRYPNFRYYMAARSLVVASTEMQAVAVGWQVYGLTHQPLDLGLVGLAQFLPGIFLFLVAGHAADRIPRQRILQGCCAGFCLCSMALLALAAHGASAVWPIYLTMVGNGAVRMFNAPTGQAFLPALIPGKHFPNAVAWGASVFTAATILGPMAGGLLYGFTGSPVPVYACAGGGYLTGLALISLIRVTAPERPRDAASRNTVLEGLRYIGRTRMILGAISLDLFAVLLGGAVALLPVYAQDVLHVGASGLGLLRSAPGAGAMIMATVVAYRPVRRHAGAAMLWSVAGFGLFTVVFGLSRNLVVSMAALALVGACDMVSVVVRQTMVQLATPDDLRGRVSAVNMIFVGASNEVGQFESGITAQWFGATPAVVLGGIGTLCVVAGWAWLFPVLRRVDQLSTEALARAEHGGNAEEQ